MSEFNLPAEVRTKFGKGASRQLRRDGKTPAVIYGHGTDPRHVALPTHQLTLAVRHANALLELDIEGEQQLALVKDVQRDPVKQSVEHIDLVVVNANEKVEVDVPLVLEGDPLGADVAIQDVNSIQVLASAIAIPEHIVVSVEGKEAGYTVTAGELQLPEGVELVTEADLLVVAVNAPEAVEEPEDEAAAAADEAEAPAAE